MPVVCVCQQSRKQWRQDQDGHMNSKTSTCCTIQIWETDHMRFVYSKTQTQKSRKAQLEK